MKDKLCCWCDDEASSHVHYAGEDHPACTAHAAEYAKPIQYANEDFDRINAKVR